MSLAIGARGEANERQDKQKTGEKKTFCGQKKKPRNERKRKRRGEKRRGIRRRSPWNETAVSVCAICSAHTEPPTLNENQIMLQETLASLQINTHASSSRTQSPWELEPGSPSPLSSHKLSSSKQAMHITQNALWQVMLITDRSLSVARAYAYITLTEKWQFQ